MFIILEHTEVCENIFVPKKYYFKYLNQTIITVCVPVVWSITYIFQYNITNILTNG